MTYKITGKCNLCGECCGYPRSTDNGQNNPWAKDLPDSLNNWTIESILEYFPLFSLIKHPKHGGENFGSIEIEGNVCHWIWIPEHGLCTDLPPYGDIETYDQRCPFLSSKKTDETVPCLLYNIEYKYIWNILCKPAPPNELETLEKVDKWFKNCPSCSYIYMRE